MDCFQLCDNTRLIYLPDEGEVFVRQLEEASLVSSVLESKLHMLANRARSAHEHRDWSEAIDAYDKVLDLLRREGASDQGLSDEQRVWFITWASVKVAPLRQLRVPSYETAVDVYDNLLGCLESLDSSRLTLLIENVKNQRMIVLFDWSHYLSVGPEDDAAQSVRLSVVCERLGIDLSRVKDVFRIEFFRMLTLQHEACGHYVQVLYWAGQQRTLLEKFFRTCAALRLAGVHKDYTFLYEWYFLYMLVDCRITEADTLSRMGESDQATANLLDLKAELEGIPDSEEFESLELSESKINSALYRVTNTLILIYLRLPDDADVRSALESLDKEWEEISGSVPSASENDEEVNINQIMDRAMEYLESSRVPECIECLKVALQKVKSNETQSIRRYGVSIADLLAVITFTKIYPLEVDGVECLHDVYEYSKESYYFASEVGDMSNIADACYRLGRTLSALLGHQDDTAPTQDIPQQLERWLKDELPEPASALLPHEDLDWLSTWLSAVYFYKLSTSLYSEILYGLRDRNTGWMKVMNDYQHTFSYGSLQILMDLMVLQLDEDTNGDLVAELSKKGLLWAERGRTRTLVYQLGPGYLYNLAPTATMREFLEFDLQDEVAWDVLRASQGACGDGTVFVEYQCTESSIIGYVVTKEGQVSMQQLPKRVQQEGLLEQSLESLISSMSDEDEYDESQVLETLEDLYTLFLEPFAKLFSNMEKTDKLVFCPHERVSHVPFALLRNPRTKRFLFEDHTVSLTPSLRVLGCCQSRFSYLRSLSTDSVSGKFAVAVGDPAYEKQRIKETLAEVKALESLFGDQCACLTGKDATVEKFLQLVEKPSLDATRSCYGIVHLAVHGHVDSNFKQGALQFASPQLASVEGQPNTPVGVAESDNTQSQEGTFADVGQVVRRGRRGTYTKKTCLRSEDITNCGFDWRVCIVVLSACNTSQGEVLAEGVLNLPRALTTVGVPCAIMSQWECVDESTAELMVEFYENLKKGDDAGTALRKSMLVLLDKKRKEGRLDIYRWGAFILWSLPTVGLPAAMLHRGNNITVKQAH